MTDLIKREDAIKAVDAFLGTDPIVERIKRLPSADRPQGEWVRMKFTDCGSPIDKCSNCGHYINGDVEVRNFCPNCGARMKGAQ